MKTLILPAMMMNDVYFRVPAKDLAHLKQLIQFKIDRTNEIYFLEHEYLSDWLQRIEIAEKEIALKAARMELVIEDGEKSIGEMRMINDLKL